MEPARQDIDNSNSGYLDSGQALESTRRAISLAHRRAAIEPLSKAEVLAMGGVWADRPPSDFEAIAI